MIDLDCDAYVRSHAGRSQQVDQTHAPRHRFKNPFTMSKTATDVAYPLTRDPLSFHPGECQAGGAYRDRTDDPLLAKQVLSQLS